MSCDIFRDSSNRRLSFRVKNVIFVCYVRHEHSTKSRLNAHVTVKNNEKSSERICFAEVNGILLVKATDLQFFESHEASGEVHQKLHQTVQITVSFYTTQVHRWHTWNFCLSTTSSNNPWENVPENCYLVQYSFD